MKAPWIIIAALVVLAIVTPSARAQIPNEAGWERVAGCESGHNWHINTGNGYYGGLQFVDGTWDYWKRFGKRSKHYALASDAPRYVQIRVAERKRRHDGMGAWGRCGGLF
jgi:hypothetical protein